MALDAESVPHGAPDASSLAADAKRTHRGAIALAISAWLLLVTGGMAEMWHYAFIPGTPGNPPASWPHNSRITLAIEPFTLVMFVHPLCSCSRVSVGELSEMMYDLGSRLHPIIVFIKPPNLKFNIENSNSWIAAAHLPNTERYVDDGTLALLFGAETSGQTVVYNREGRLLFSGGITMARGHWGDNIGEDKLTDVVQHPANLTVRENPVYGCALFSAKSRAARNAK